MQEHLQSNNLMGICLLAAEAAEKAYLAARAAGTTWLQFYCMYMEIFIDIRTDTL
jgi:hypothetical protein